MSMRKGAVSREKLLTAAEKLFAANGYHGTTVSQIVKEAGLTQASFYQYFKSKEAIRDEILHKFEEELDKFVATGLALSDKQQADVEKHLLAAYIDLFRLLGANRNVTRMVFKENEKGERLRQKMLVAMCNNMRKNQDAGILRAEIDCDLLAELLVATVERIVNRYALSKNVLYSPVDLGQALAEIIFHGALSRER